MLKPHSYFANNFYINLPVDQSHSPLDLFFSFLCFPTTHSHAPTFYLFYILSFPLRKSPPHVHIYPHTPP